MKKTLLATLIPALFFANAASANVELYKDDVNTFSVGGHLSAGFTDSDDKDLDVESISSRINFEATRVLSNGFTADAKVEWAINMQKGGDNSLTTRLGYLGLTHESYGRAVLGTQWVPTYAVTGVADMPLALANDFLYDDMELGRSRADRMFSYTNSWAFSQDVALNLGLGWQASDSVTTEKHEMDQTTGLYEFSRTTVKYDDRYQAALSLDISKFSFGLAYNDGDVDNEDSTYFNVSAKYGTYGKGLYLAGVYGDNDVADLDSTEIELLAAYAFANTVNVSLNYEEVDPDHGSDIRETAALQVEYNFLPNVIGYVGYQADLDESDDVFKIGGRIIL